MVHITIKQHLLESTITAITKSHAKSGDYGKTLLSVGEASFSCVRLKADTGNDDK